jgi:hypothetical protein
VKGLRRRIEATAGELATDDELCRIFNLRPEQLERFRRTIDAARTAAQVHLRYEREKARANGRKA